VIAVWWLAAGFAGIIATGTLLVAVHDVIAGRVAATPAPAAGTRPPGGCGPETCGATRHSMTQLDGAAMRSTRSWIQATAASKPAGRVSRWRAPGTLT
jgi:hypothetical protein